MAQLAIVADDLTGAADTSACFAAAGYATVIPLSGAPPAADVLALSTETRDMTAEEVAAVVGAAVSGLYAGPPASRPRWLYKKIDSALRGHPRDELFAALDAAGAIEAVVAPAVPSEGRTTVRGHQHIGGVSLQFSSLGHPADTSDLSQIFANDRGWPVRRIDLNMIRHQPDAISDMLAAQPTGIVVADAELDGDLAVLARAVCQSQVRVLCGAAGLARQLAPLLPLAPAVTLPITPRGDHPILVVAGSRHGATARQIAALKRSGAPVVRFSQTHIDDLTSSVAAIVSEVAGHLAAGRTTVVTTTGLSPSASGERAVAARLAEIATAPQVLRSLGGLVLTGGDVAMAACQALAATALWLGGEIYPGQPWGLLAGGARPGLPVATKAGSFGADDALLRCVAHLIGMPGPFHAQHHSGVAPDREKA